MSDSVTTFICAVRGTEHPITERVVVFDGREICQDECDDNWFTSDHSGGVYPNSDLASDVRDDRDNEISITHGERHSGWFFDDEVQLYYPNDSIVNVSGFARRGRGIRRISRYTYANGNWFTCDGCGCVFHTDDEQGDCHCPSCADSGDDDDGFEIYSYGEGLPPHKRWSVAAPFVEPANDHLVRLFGIELEVITPRDERSSTAAAIDDAFGAGERGFAIYREDGSLCSSDGVEIISCPATLDVHRHFWPRGLRAACNCTAWDSPRCGMHVHISRTALSQLQIGKMLCFLHAPETTKFVEFVAGRSANTYCQRPAKKVSDALKSDGRYVALNLDNDNTVEVRIFRSTVNVDRFLSNLEFCDALCEWTLPGNSSLMTTKDQQAFVEFVGQHRKRWPKFAQRLVNSNYLRAPKTVPPGVTARKRKVKVKGKLTANLS